ncbi:MAG: hypothetical protein ACFFB3_14345 [Candidatus Hodarchaeota archaeon]
MLSPRQVSLILFIGIALEVLAILLIIGNTIALLTEDPTSEEQRVITRRLALIFTGATAVSVASLWAFLRYREEHGLATKMLPSKNP